MRTHRPRNLTVDQMETRALLSGMAPPDAAVVADVAKIKSDSTQLIADAKTLAPTLKADVTAIQTAIANSSTVQAAKTTFNNDESAAQSAIQADLKVFWSASSKTARQAAFAQLQTDVTAAQATLKADVTAIQSAVSADPTISAASAKLTSDEAPITADQATLKADYTQLATDLKAQYGHH